MENAIFKLKLSTKVSNEAYRHCKQLPIYGTGQGSGNSPVIWCFVSSKPFQCYEDEAHGMMFYSPDGSISFSMAIIGFVDDTTCITAGDPSKPLVDMLQCMQEDAQLWNDLLWSSGGALELPKCGYHTIYYSFDASGIPRLTHHHDHQVTIQSATGDAIPICQKNIFTPRKNLGHLKSPAGTYQAQFNGILAKATGIVDGIVSSGSMSLCIAQPLNIPCHNPF